MLIDICLKASSLSMRTRLTFKLSKYAIRRVVYIEVEQIDFIILPISNV